MFSDEPSFRGAHLPATEIGAPPPLLFVAPETKPFLVGIPQGAIFPAPADSVPATVTDLLSTTAPIHKVSRSAPEPAARPSGSDTNSNTEPDGLTQTHPQTSPPCSTSSISSSLSKITGVATIILPPHHNNNSSQALSSPAALCPKLSHPKTPSSASLAPKLSYPLSSTSTASSSSSPLPGSIFTNPAVLSNSSISINQPSPPRGTTVIDLNLCSTLPVDVNNNDITITTKTFGVHKSSNASKEHNSSPVKTRACDNSINSNNISAYDTTSISNPEKDEQFISAPLKSLEQFLSDQLPFDLGKEGDVFADPNEACDKYNCKFVGCTDFGTIVKSEADISHYSPIPPSVLPSISSFINEQSSSPYSTSIPYYSTSGQYYHHSQSVIEGDSMATMAGLPTSDTDIMMNINPVVGLSRSDSGFCSNGRTNSSSSYCSSTSSSVDMECDEPWGSDLVEERNYTDLTSVRSACPGQELLPSIMHEEEDGSLQILLSDSGNLKTEPPEEYTGFSYISEFMNDFHHPDLDSDGYSSSTDNEGPHYTQLEEASRLFSGNTIMAGFPPLPVLSTDQAKLPISSTVSSHLGQPSPSSDQSDSEHWVVAKENLPDFGKLQDPSAEEEERPTPSRRLSGSSSPKERRKMARESPTLSEKSLSDRKKPGRKKGQVSNVLHLWEFMRDLLKDPRTKGDIIEWISEKDGVFRVVNSAEVAKLWGEKKKNKKEMTYEKMSRSLRYSRLEGYFSDLPKDKNYPKKLCFKFGPKSKDWY